MKALKYLVIILGFSILLIYVFYKDLFPYYPFSPDIEITLYGRPGCSNCRAFIKSLDENNIPYKFKNVDAGYKIEMWDLIYEVYDGNPKFQLPVVLIGDNLFLNTSFEKAMESYGQRKFILFGN